MSLAAEWDAVPVQNARAPARLSDEWDSIKPSPKIAETRSAPSVGGQVVDAAVEGITLPAKVAANMVTGIGSSILGGWKALATVASGGSLDDAASAVRETGAAGTYQPTGAAGKVAELAQAPGEVVAAGGRIAGRTAMDIGASPGTAAAIETAVNAAPLLLLRGGKSAPKGTAIVRENIPAMATDATNYDVPTVARRGTVPQLTNAPGETLPPPQVRARQPVAQPLNAPPKFELDQQSGAVQPQPAVKFGEAVEIAPPGKPLPASEVARRQEVLKSVGISEARKSALAGDMTEANTEAQIALKGDEAGKLMKAKLDAERAALTNHAEQIVRDTGGSLGTDQSSLIARGNTILAPLDALKDWFTNQTKALYAEARAKAQGQTAELSRFGDILKTDSKFANTDTIELRKGIQARMRELGMMDKDGNMLAATVDQAENLRQYIGEEWSPKNNFRIRDLKSALDEDVTSAAGEDTFAKARALHAMKKATLEDPKGIAKIMDSEGPAGINRAVSIEKIADTVTGLPSAQLAHIVKTLQNVPAELQPQASAALAEIKAHFANRILEAGSSRAGQWGARDVTKYLNNNSARLPQVFSKQELARIEALNEAGNILRIEKGYPGATVQAENIGRALGEHAIESGATAAGALVGSAVGAPGTGAKLGAILGRIGIGEMSKASKMRAVEERFVRLGDVAPK